MIQWKFEFEIEYFVKSLYELDNFSIIHVCYISNFISDIQFDYAISKSRYDPSNIYF